MRFEIISDYSKIEITVKDIEELKAFMRENSLENCSYKKVANEETISNENN